MSHFTVLVPAGSEKELDQKLLPYYEYGCSKHYDELVKPYLEFAIEHHKEDFEIDAQEILDRDSVQTDHDSREQYKLWFEDKLYTLIFADWDGGTLGPNGNWGRWRNPNAKWDWYSIGGRWTGMLSAYDPEADPQNWEICFICHGTGDRQGWVEYKPHPEQAGERLRIFKDEWSEKCNGCNSCKGKGVTLKHPGFFVTHNGDSPTNQDVDWETLASKQLERKIETYHVYHAAWKRAKANFSWSDIPERKMLDEKEKYFEQSEWGKNARSTYQTFDDWMASRERDVILRKEYNIHAFWSFDEIKYFHNLTEDEYRDKFKTKALSFAFIDLEGKWNERADMGWFGMTGDDIPGYDEAFWQFVESLSPNQRIYVVDCHI